MTVDAAPNALAMPGCPFCRLAGPIRFPGTRASASALDLLTMAPLAASVIGRVAP